MKIECPSCSTPLKAPDDAIGKKARCKECGEVFRLTEELRRQSLEDSVALWIGGEEEKNSSRGRRQREPASDPLLHLYEEARRRDQEKKRQPAETADDAPTGTTESTGD